MSTINAMLKRFEKLNTDQVINQAFDETVDKVAELNREQLLSGFDKKGKRLRRYASNQYAKKKQAMNPLPGLGNPDLNLTGKHHAGITARRNGSDIVSQSTDSKSQQLEASYGDIYGLGGVFKEEYVEDHLLPTVRKKITTLTGLKFG